MAGRKRAGDFRAAAGRTPAFGLKESAKPPDPARFALVLAAAAVIAVGMLFLAATAMEKLKEVPPSFWLKVLLGVGIFVGAFIILRKVAAMNKVVLAVIVFIVVIVGGVNWIYERNEPAMLTPFINKIAPFFPSKGSYGGKQQGGPKV